jgi:hypothetical protein
MRIAGYLLIAFELLRAASAQGFISTIDGAQHECMLKRENGQYLTLHNSSRALEQVELLAFMGFSNFCLNRVKFSANLTIVVKPTSLCFYVTHISSLGTGPTYYRAFTLSFDPIAKLIALIVQDKLFIVNATSAEKISQMDVNSSMVNFANLHFDYTTHRLYGEYWDGERERFVEVQYQNKLNATIRSISTIDCTQKELGTRTIDYHKGIFYMMGSKPLISTGYQLLGIRLDTGAEVSRATLNSTFRGRLIFDDASMPHAIFWRGARLSRP